MTEYTVIPDKGVTVGKIDKEDCTCVRHEVTDKCSEDTARITSHILFNSDVLDIDFDDHWYFKAVSIAREGDEFDDKTGRIIVDAKLSYKYHDLMQRKYKQIISQLKSSIKELEKLQENHIKARNKCDEKLANYL